MFQRNSSRGKETSSDFQISFDTQDNHFDGGLGLANNNKAIVVIAQIFRFHFIELSDFSSYNRIHDFTDMFIRCPWNTAV